MSVSGRPPGRVGAPMVGQEGPGRTPGSNNASNAPKGVGRLEVVATPVNYGTERIEAAELGAGARTDAFARRPLPRAATLDITYTALAQLRDRTGPFSLALKEAARAVRCCGVASTGLRRGPGPRATISACCATTACYRADQRSGAANCLGRAGLLRLRAGKLHFGRSEGPDGRAGAPGCATRCRRRDPKRICAGTCRRTWLMHADGGNPGSC